MAISMPGSHRNSVVTVFDQPPDITWPSTQTTAARWSHGVTQRSFPASAVLLSTETVTLSPGPMPYTVQATSGGNNGGFNNNNNGGFNNNNGGFNNNTFGGMTDGSGGSNNDGGSGNDGGNGGSFGFGGSFFGSNGGSDNGSGGSDNEGGAGNDGSGGSAGAGPDATCVPGGPCDRFLSTCDPGGSSNSCVCIGDDEDDYTYLCD